MLEPIKVCGLSLTKSEKNFELILHGTANISGHGLISVMASSVADCNIAPSTDEFKCVQPHQTCQQVEIVYITFSEKRMKVAHCACTSWLGPFPLSDFH